jgi:hypothetical protein
VLYFGLREDLTYYMSLMSKEFMEYRIKFVVVKIDDVLVYSKVEEEHEEHLRLVVQKLRKNLTPSTEMSSRRLSDVITYLKVLSSSRRRSSRI